MLKKTTGTFGRRLPIEARSDEKNPFWSIAVKLLPQFIGVAWPEREIGFFDSELDRN
jgi:hypothetical protein